MSGNEPIIKTRYRHLGVLYEVREQGNMLHSVVQLDPLPAPKAEKKELHIAIGKLEYRGEKYKTIFQNGELCSVTETKARNPVWTEPEVIKCYSCGHSGEIGLPYAQNTEETREMLIRELRFYRREDGGMVCAECLMLTDDNLLKEASLLTKTELS